MKQGPGAARAYKFILGVEQRQRKQLQRDMWRLCDENRRLGGKYWRRVLIRFGMTENQIWPKEPPARETI